MKTTTVIKKTLGMAALLAAAASSWGYTIDGGVTDVGDLDVFVGSTSALLDSSPTSETNWLNSLINPDTTFTVKTETVNYYKVDGDNSFYALGLASDPGYYILKNATYWAAFRNLASLDWAVFDISILPGGMNLGGTGELTISHVSEFGGTTRVPEPGSVGLLAAGVLGLVATRRLGKKA